MSVQEIVYGAVTGYKVLNWFFPAIIILYGLFALSLLICKELKLDDLGLVVVNVILVSVFSLLLLIAFLKGYVLVHWLISLYAFPMGVLFALFDIYKYLGKKNMSLILIAFILIFSLCYIVDANGNFIIRVLKMSWYYMVSIMICILAYYYIRNRCSNKVCVRIGKRSAEIILTQNMALTMFRNDRIFVDNDIAYLFIAIVIQLILVCLLLPAYDLIKRSIKNCGEMLIRKYD